MGIASWIHDYGIIASVSFLQLIDEHAFVVGLEIGNLVSRETLAELHEIFLKGEATIDLGFAFAQEVEVGAVENEDFPLGIFLQK